jgi:hypothetical protein
MSSWCMDWDLHPKVEMKAIWVQSEKSCLRIKGSWRVRLLHVLRVLGRHAHQIAAQPHVIAQPANVRRRDKLAGQKAIGTKPQPPLIPRSRICTCHSSVSQPILDFGGAAHVPRRGRDGRQRRLHSAAAHCGEHLKSGRQCPVRRRGISPSPTGHQCRAAGMGARRQLDLGGVCYSRVRRWDRSQFEERTYDETP